MPAPPEDNRLPADTVNVLMTIEHEGDARIPRFKPDAKAAILSHLPPGATYDETGADYEGFTWTTNGVRHSASVLIDAEKLEDAGIDWDSPATTAADLVPYIIVQGDSAPTAVEDQAALSKAIDLAERQVPAGGRRRRKTKKRVAKRRKTLRRRRIA